MRHLLAAGLVALIAMGASASAAEIDWKKLPYFVYETGQFYVTTDASWSNSDPVRTSPGQRASEPPLPFSDRGMKRDFIWAKTCPAGAQFVSFSKTFLVPGDPYEALVLLEYGPRSVRPYNSATLLLNGVEVARLGRTAVSRRIPPSFQGPLAGADLKAFRYGPNTLTVRVAKAALPKGQRCTDRTGYVGIVADLTARFGSAVHAVPLQQGDKTFQRFSPGASAGYSGRFSIVNDGLSSALAGEARFNFDAGLYVEVAILDPSPVPPFTMCVKEIVVPLKSYEFRCRFSNLRAGQRATMTFNGGFKVAANFPQAGTTNLRVGWGILHVDTNDVGRGPNVLTAENVFCGPQAPSCG